jgi:hypothetical protein
MSLEEHSVIISNQEVKTTFLDWRRLFTGLLGVGIVAFVTFLFAAWNIVSDVQSMSTDVKSLATKDDVANAQSSTLNQSKSYTDTKVNLIAIEISGQRQATENVKEQIKELKSDQRETSRDLSDTLKQIQKDVNKVQVSVGATR